MKYIPDRATKRGAVFVESIIVLSFFVLCFFGVVFFRQLYSGKIHVQQLARASAMAHAMRACTGDPAAGIEDDIPQPAENKNLDSKSDSPQAPLDTKGDTTAADSLKNIERSGGGVPLVGITTIKIKTSAAAVPSKDSPSKNQGFKRNDVASESFVVCADPVSDGQYEEIFPHIQSLFSNHF